MPRMLRYASRQNAHFREEIFFFSEEDPHKAALFLFNQIKSKNPKTHDVRQDKYRQHTWRLSGQKWSELRDIDRVFRPLLTIVLEKGSERLRSKKASCHQR